MIGPTGDFPEGKLNDADEGGIAIAISIERGTVCVAFGKPISWFGMGPELALAIAQTLTAKALELLKERAEETAG